MLQTPLPVLLCFFHRLLTIFRLLWEEEISASSAPVIPLKMFYDDSINLFDVTRLGGLASHLKKTLKEDLDKAMGPPTAGFDPLNTLETAGAASTSALHFQTNTSAQFIDTDMETSDTVSFL